MNRLLHATIVLFFLNAILISGITIAVSEECDDPDAGNLHVPGCCIPAHPKPGFLDEDCKFVYQEPLEVWFCVGDCPADPVGGPVPMIPGKCNDEISSDIPESSCYIEEDKQTVEQPTVIDTDCNAVAEPGGPPEWVLGKPIRAAGYMASVSDEEANSAKILDQRGMTAVFELLDEDFFFTEIIVPETHDCVCLYILESDATTDVDICDCTGWTCGQL